MPKTINKIIVTLWMFLLLALIVVPLIVLTLPLPQFIGNFFWTNPIFGRILYGYTTFFLATQPFSYDNVPIIIINAFLVDLAVAYFLISRDRINVLFRIGSFIKLFFIAILEICICYCGWYLANHFAYYCDKGIVNYALIVLFGWGALTSFFYFIYSAIMADKKSTRIRKSLIFGLINNPAWFWFILHFQIGLSLGFCKI